MTENDFTRQIVDRLERSIDTLPKSLDKLSDSLSRLEIVLLRSQLAEEKEKVKSLERRLAGNSKETKPPVYSEQDIERAFQYNGWKYATSITQQT